jgi:hypothetical protein
VKIQHSFPVLGSIEVPLYKESAKLFNMFESLPNSGTIHWQSLDHLGELRSVLRCGHHSRYEYLILQLYLTHIFKQVASAFGFSTGVQLPNGSKISSAEELIKC